MRFDYGEKNPERLAIAIDIASSELELNSHCVMSNESLWRFYDDKQSNPMGILATRSGILSAVSAAYVLNHDEIFRAAARLLVLRGKDLVDLVQRPCVPGIELCLAILLGDALATADIATAILNLPVNLASHPEDGMSMVIAKLVAGKAESTNVLLGNLPRFQGLSKSDLEGWRLWTEAVSNKGIAQEALDALIAHEKRIVRTELSKLARGKESCLSSLDLVCFNLEALKLLCHDSNQPKSSFA